MIKTYIDIEGIVMMDHQSYDPDHLSYFFNLAINAQPLEKDNSDQLVEAEEAFPEARHQAFMAKLLEVSAISRGDQLPGRSGK